MITPHTNQSFSMDDIRKVRDADYERRRDMTPAELAKDIHDGAEEGRRIMKNKKHNPPEASQR